MKKLDGSTMGICAKVHIRHPANSPRSFKPAAISLCEAANEA